MNKYTLDFIKNKVNEVISNCSKPQKKCLHQLVRQLYVKGTPILRHLVQDDGRNIKPETRKFSRHLENIELEKEVDNFVFKQVQKNVQEDTVIAYDLSDINKDNSKKLPNLSKVFDGSRRKKADGFWLHGVGVLGFLLKFQIHQVDSETLPQTRKNIIFELAKKLEYKGIWAMDRGNDSKQFFHDLAEKNIKFICRLRSNRLLVLKSTGELKKLKDLQDGEYEIHLLNTHNNKVETDTTYTLIIKEHLKDKESMRLISNLSFKDFSAEEFLKKYLQRWGVEKSFRRIKTKFSLEKIRVLSENRFLNLIALIRLAMAIAKVLYTRIFQEQKQILLHLCQTLSSYETFLKKKSLYQNIDSFITFLSQDLPQFVNRKTTKPPNLCLFSNYALAKLTPF